MIYSGINFLYLRAIIGLDPATTNQQHGEIHYATCTVCEAHPIFGDLYKCTVCPEYTLCKSCKIKSNHTYMVQKFSTGIHVTLSSMLVHIYIYHNGQFII